MKTDLKMKKNIFWLTAFIFLSLRIQAQSPGPKWEKIFESKDETVYVDTSTIKQFEKQISLLSITIYKTPKMISSINSEAASVKTQLLFNVPVKKYTLIGTLYYNKNLKILGETSLPGFASSSDNFSLPIDGNAAMEAIFNKALNYLKSTQPQMEGKTVQTETKDAKDNTSPGKPAVKQTAAKIQAEDSAKSAARVALFLSKKDSVQKAAAQYEPKKIDPPKKSEEKSAVKKEAAKPVADKKVLDSQASSQEQETNPKSTIFKQGNKYAFQVSSWRYKSKAETEVKRLNSKGHNSFIAEGLVKGVTWYRVRIGYFNSIEETEAYMKKVQ